MSGAALDMTEKIKLLRTQLGATKRVHKAQKALHRVTQRERERQVELSEALLRQDTITSSGGPTACMIEDVQTSSGGPTACSESGPKESRAESSAALGSQNQEAQNTLQQRNQTQGRKQVKGESECSPTKKDAKKSP